MLKSLLRTNSNIAYAFNEDTFNKDIFNKDTFNEITSIVIVNSENVGIHIKLAQGA